MLIRSQLAKITFYNVNSETKLLSKDERRGEERRAIIKEKAIIIREGAKLLTKHERSCSAVTINLMKLSALINIFETKLITFQMVSEMPCNCGCASKIQNFQKFRQSFKNVVQLWMCNCAYIHTAKIPVVKCLKVENHDVCNPVFAIYWNKSKTWM